jgi:queuine/archaeosine tRNA-ribosyltransferase
LFGIIQGGMYEDLRDESLKGLKKLVLMVMPLVVCLSVNRKKK